MLILGIETSCDETAAAVLKDGQEILSDVVYSQIALHRPYGGVVPELAARRHLDKIVPVVEEALSQAGVDLTAVEGIAVTRGPGLVGALLVGLCFAKSLSAVSRVPLLGINHIEGHICSIFLEKEVPFPFLSLTVSGGHTSLFLVKGIGAYEVLGQTRDDAAGEAFDKVAKLLDLGYPGGGIIESLAEKGNPRIRFPRAIPSADSLDFSFSGIKTAVVNYVKGFTGNRGCQRVSTRRHRRFFSGGGGGYVDQKSHSGPKKIQDRTVGSGRRGGCQRLSAPTLRGNGP